MLQIAVLGQGPPLNQQDRQRTHEHGPDRQAQGDNHHVVRQGEGPDHPVEAERGIQHIEIEEAAQPGPDHDPRRTLRRLAHFQQGADGLDRDEGRDAQNAGDQEGQGLGCLEQQRNAVERQQQAGDLRRLDVRNQAQLLLDRLDPVDVLLLVEEEAQPDHGQEGAAEPGDADVGAADDRLVADGIVEREAQRIEGAQSRGDADDRQRKQHPHAEHGDHHAPGEEAAAPDGVHRFEHGGVDHRVVERERDLQHREDHHDPQQRQGAPGRAGLGPAIGGAQPHANQGEDHRPGEIGRKRTLRRCGSGSGGGGHFGW